MFLKNKTYRFKILYNLDHAYHPTLKRSLVGGEIVDLFITYSNLKEISYKVLMGDLRIDNTISISAIKLMDNFKFITIESLSYIIESGAFVRAKYVA